MGIKIINRVDGRKIFHLKFIKKSYRNRGRVPRIQSKIEFIINNIINEDSRRGDLKNIMVVINMSRIILIYSDKKIKANQPPMYSTLNPDTSSDSPSAKSKGLRLVSAKHVISHIASRMVFPQKKYIRDWELNISLKEYE